MGYENSGGQLILGCDWSVFDKNKIKSFYFACCVYAGHVIFKLFGCLLKPKPFVFKKLINCSTSPLFNSCYPTFK